MGGRVTATGIPVEISGASLGGLVFGVPFSFGATDGRRVGTVVCRLVGAVVAIGSAVGALVGTVVVAGLIVGPEVDEGDFVGAAEGLLVGDRSRGARLSWVLVESFLRIRTRRNPDR